MIDPPQETDHGRFQINPWTLGMFFAGVLGMAIDFESWLVQTLSAIKGFYP